MWRGRIGWMAGSVLLMVALVLSHTMLLLLHLPSSYLKNWNNPLRSTRNYGRFAPLQLVKSSGSLGLKDMFDIKNDGGSDDPMSNPFAPPLYGYESLAEMDGRSSRFPSKQDRAKVYLSDWYSPPCVKQRRFLKSPNDDGFLHYHFLKNGTGNGALAVREIKIAATVHQDARTFTLNSDSTLGKIHFMERTKMSPDQCSSEYCADAIRHWFPAWDRSSSSLYNIPIPVFFQFSDEELSKGFDSMAEKVVPYPALPHLKKSRFALVEPLSETRDGCCAVPRPTSATVIASELGNKNMLEHLQPIIFKLKTNRHYGMMSAIPRQDIQWAAKKDQAIFRGTLTGLLPPESRFSLALRGSDAPMLSGRDAKEKCYELDRCRLVYQVNRFYKTKHNDKQLVDAKLVNSELQHIDMPEKINKIALFGNKMTKESLLAYKVIVMLEGNDAGTGFKWALFSNSVVMTAKIKYTSWAMEELLEPWVHYIPLDANNFEEDVHTKMKWVLDHDEEARDIARRGSLWIRDLLQHPDADSDDEAIADEMVRRYSAHFVHDSNLL